MQPRRWIIASALTLVACGAGVRSASAAEIGAFFWDDANSWFTLINTADTADTPFPDLQLFNPIVELNGDPLETMPLFGDPFFDPSGDASHISAGFAANTVPLTGNIATALFFLGGSNLDGSLTLDYFHVDPNTFDVTAADSWTSALDYATVDFTAASPAPVPEPATLTLFGIGAGILGIRRRRRARP